MFYQNNNDYMRDAFYYSQPQSNYTYQYQDMNNYSQNGNMPNMMSGFCYTNYESMYPPVYRIIEPVARRVVSNNNYPYYTEDNISNMVDTVYNIVQGDVSTLSGQITEVESDDAVTQGPARGALQSSAKTNDVEVSKTVNNDNQLLKDLIKIIIIKLLLSKPSGPSCMNNNCSYNTYMPSYYDSRYFGTN